MANTHQVIYIAANIEQAHMLRNFLVEQGIFAYVSNEALQIADGNLPFGQPTAPRVIVDEHDADEARRIALEFDRGAGQSSGEDLSREELDTLETDAEREAAEWPECPHCKRPRQTSCPVCETAGTKFPPAFMPSEDSGSETHANGERQQPLVMCPTCDEPFVPEYLARCEWCGHRFRDGRELPLPPTTTPLLSEMNGRVWIVIGALALLFVATLAMLAHIAPEP